MAVGRQVWEGRKDGGGQVPYLAVGGRAAVAALLAGQRRRLRLALQAVVRCTRLRLLLGLRLLPGLLLLGPLALLRRGAGGRAAVAAVAARPDPAATPARRCRGPGSAVACRAGVGCWQRRPPRVRRSRAHEASPRLHRRLHAACRRSGSRGSGPVGRGRASQEQPGASFGGAPFAYVGLGLAQDRSDH